MKVSPLTALLAALTFGAGVLAGRYWLPDAASRVPQSEAECFAIAAQARTGEGALMVGDYCRRQYREQETAGWRSGTPVPDAELRRRAEQFLNAPPDPPDR